MKHLLYFLLVFTSFPFKIFAQDTPFPCDGELYISQRVGLTSTTELYQIEVGEPVNLNLVATTPVYYNCIAFNVNDNFIYGLNPNTLTMFRIDRNGTATNLGNPIGLSTFGHYTSGAFSNNSEYVVTGGDNNTIEVLDVTTSPPTLLSSNTKKYIDGNSGTPQFQDLAFDPLDNTCYGFDFNLKRLSKIDPNTGETEAFGVLQSQVNFLGSVFFAANGDLYGYGAKGGSTQNTTLFQINKQTGVLQEKGIGPNTPNSDGCSCPFTLQFTKQADKTEICLGETITYIFEITNNSKESLQDVTFRDVLPQGTRFLTDIDNLMGGTISDNTGMGFNAIEVTNMQIPTGASSFTIEVVVESNASNTISNQAELTNLPTLFSETLVSDNPSTPIKDDATDVSISTPTIDIEVSSNSPVCIGESLQFSAEEIVGFDYKWEGPNGFESDVASPNIEVVTTDNIGLYTLTVIEIEGCATLVTSIEADVALPPVVSLGEDISVCEGKTIIFDISESMGTYLWQDGSTEPIFEISEAGTYSVEVRNECGTDRASLEVGFVVCEEEGGDSGNNCKLTFLNAFSPNEDGTNDFFRPYTNCNLASYHLEIYSRFGNKIFETDDYNEGWNGVFENQPQPVGVYAWHATYTLQDESGQTSSKMEKGNLTLIR